MKYFCDPVKWTHNTKLFLSAYLKFEAIKTIYNEFGFSWVYAKTYVAF
jgi:hypothetical protein